MRILILWKRVRNMFIDSDANLNPFETDNIFLDPNAYINPLETDNIF